MSPPEKAAMLLFFEIIPEALEEHDDWHSHEHIQERLSIPGFLRATRWRACDQENRYFVMYEVENIDVLSSPAYMERLNNPSPWTTKMMAHYRGMQRGLCRHVRTAGHGLGQGMLAVHFQPAEGRQSELLAWLEEKVLSVFPSRAGLAGFHLYTSGLTPQNTREQNIRGKDQSVHWVLLATAYDMKALERLSKEMLSKQVLEANGAEQIHAKCYRLEFLMDAPG